MSNIQDTDYRQWKKAILGDNFSIWHDGLYTDSAEALKGNDRENGIQMLLYGIKTGDSHAASTLAAMKETSTLPQIRAALGTSTGEHKVRLACAIHVLSPKDSDAMSKELVQVLGNVDGDRSSKMDAAMALRDYRDELSEAALLKAVEDKEYLVRYHVHDSLIRRWGVKEQSDIFKLICEEDGSNETARRREAVVRLEKLRDRKR